MTRKIVGKCEIGHSFPVVLTDHLNKMHTAGPVSYFTMAPMLTDEQHLAAHVNFLKRMDKERPSCPVCGTAVKFTMIEKEQLA